MIYDLLIKSLKMGFKQKGYKKKILQMLPSRKIPVTVTTPSFHGSNMFLLSIITIHSTPGKMVRVL